MAKKSKPKACSAAGRRAAHGRYSDLRKRGAKKLGSKSCK